MAYQVSVKYFNTFWLKKTIYLGNLTPTVGAPDATRGGYGSNFPGLVWLGTSEGYPNFPSGCGREPTYDEVENWFIEEARYQGGFNDVATDYGAKAYLKEDFNKPEIRTNALIHSGLYNSRTGINNTNVFSVGESIMRAVDPQKGTIQRLYAEDTNLVIFQEDKVNRALIDKDQIYTTEGGTQTLPPGTVIGQITPYVGEFGISKNPESFAVYGFRKYFADKDRGSIMRLSRDGLTEISEYGMSNFFRDALKDISEFPQPLTINKVSDGTYSVPAPGGSKWIGLQAAGTDIPMGSQLIVNGIEYPIYVTGVDANDVTLTEYFSDASNIPLNGDPISFRYYKKDKVLGGWDIFDRAYTVSIQQETADDWYTLAFDEAVLGWPTFYSYKPNQLFSLKNTFFSTKSGEVYEHYFSTSANNRNVFYGAPPATSSITFVLNPTPNVNKNFQTIGYEGSNGWQMESYQSDIEGNFLVNGLSNVNYIDNNVILSTTTPVAIRSYYEGAYDGNGNEYPAVLTPPIYRGGFDLKEGKYMTNLVSGSSSGGPGGSARPEEVVFGPDAYGGYPMSGIKGYVATVKLSTDATTDLGGSKQLFAAYSNYVVSSY